MKLIFSIILSGMICFQMIGQIGGPTFKQVVNAGEKYLLNKDYYAAFKTYEEALRYEIDEERMHNKAGEAAWKLGALNSAEEHFEWLFNSENAGMYADLTFKLGVIKQQMAKYDEAEHYFKLYLSENEEDEMTPLMKRSQIGIESCHWAKKQIADTLVSLQHMGEQINSPYSDFAAQDLKDEMFFSSLIGKKHKDSYKPTRKIAKVMMYNETDGKRIMRGDMNGDTVHNANVSFGPKNDFVYYTKCDYYNGAQLRCDIYTRKIISDTIWGRPKKLPNKINLKGFTATQPFLAFDARKGRNVLYFVSDRPGGVGGLDIWYSEVIGNGVYSDPVNIKELNTEFDEMSPFFLSSENELYYSSAGLKGFGGLDVYRSKVEGKNFSAPINLGLPTNSSYDDVYFKKSADESYAYISSNRTGSYFFDEGLEACCFDIYKVYYIPPPMTLLVSTYDDYDKSPILGAQTRLIELGGTRDISFSAPDTSNTGTTEIEHDKEYQLIASKPGYLNDTLTFHTRDIRKINLLTQSLFLTKIVPLEVTVWDDNTDEPLSDAVVKFYNVINGEEILVKRDSNPNGNDYHYQLIRGNSYKVSGTKTKYDMDYKYITAEETGKGAPIEKRIGLVRSAIRMLEKVLPLVLFFENDEPEPKTKKITTGKRYKDTYVPYYAKKKLYESNFSKAYTNEHKSEAIASVDAFFETDLKGGYSKLELFMEQVLGVLEGGLYLEVSIKGYTSPIAKGDYNFRLGKRRVACLKNEFYEWQNGLLIQYIDKGTLVLKEISFGETKAPEGLSDSPFDRGNSVYSPLASKERRVEIIAVKRLAKAKRNSSFR